MLCLYCPQEFEFLLLTTVAQLQLLYLQLQLPHSLVPTLQRLLLAPINHTLQARAVVNLLLRKGLEFTHILLLALKHCPKLVLQPTHPSLTCLLCTAPHCLRQPRMGQDAVEGGSLGGF